MKLASLFSGGKDSVFALYLAKQKGWDITHLVTIQSQNPASFMFHTVNIHLVEQLSQALDIPLCIARTQGEKEKELSDLEEILKTLDVDGVVSGAIASDYQRKRIEQICTDLNIESITPLWHKDQTNILYDQINAGFTILIVGVFAEGFDETWLGKTLNKHTIEEITQIQECYGINPAGEGGEYETLVIDGPIFKQSLTIEQAKPLWNRDSGIYQIQQVSLQEKH